MDREKAEENTERLEERRGGKRGNRDRWSEFCVSQEEKGREEKEGSNKDGEGGGEGNREE